MVTFRSSLLLFSLILPFSRLSAQTPPLELVVTTDVSPLSTERIKAFRVVVKNVSARTISVIVPGGQTLSATVKRTDGGSVRSYTKRCSSFLSRSRVTQIKPGEEIEVEENFRMKLTYDALQFGTVGGHEDRNWSDTSNEKPEIDKGFHLSLSGCTGVSLGEELPESVEIVFRYPFPSRASHIDLPGEVPLNFENCMKRGRYLASLISVVENQLRKERGEEVRAVNDDEKSQFCAQLTDPSNEFFSGTLTSSSRLVRLSR